jgi:hypothetical protein
MKTRTATFRRQGLPTLDFPSKFQDDSTRKHILIVHLAGNPGLIRYYEPFLRHIRCLLDDKESENGCRHAFHIQGRNLIGFADSDHEPAYGTTFSDSEGVVAEPFVVEDQIRAICDHLCRMNNPTSQCETKGRSRGFDEIILMGHSVGSYICTEVIHRHYLARKGYRTGVLKYTSVDQFANLPLKAGILLVPTLTHIALSPKGRKLTLLSHFVTPYLLSSLLTPAAHALTWGLDHLPAWLRTSVVRFLTGGFPEHAEKATLEFLRQRDAIWQGLHMGVDEMERIAEERWEEEMWEGEEAMREVVEGEEKDGNGNGAAKFYLFFASKDHWVADHCRDEFIERRQSNEKARRGTKVVVDEAGLPHAFCIRKCYPIVPFRVLDGLPVFSLMPGDRDGV